MHYITDTLYWISTGLLVPVIVLLIWFFLRALLLLGSWFGHYLDVRRLQGRLDSLVANLTPDAEINIQQSERRRAASPWLPR